MANTRQKRLQIARRAADTKLFRLKNVVGSCFGLKIKDGKRTDEVCVTVFVKSKKKKSRLEENDIIPEHVRRHGMNLQTDVVELKRVRLESGFPILDGTQKGTIGCFGRNQDGLFAVTCAHCITGIDDDFNSPNLMTIEFPAPGLPLSLGQSAGGIQFNGIGIFPDFGDFDAGMAKVSSLPVAEYAANKPALLPFRPSANQIAGPELQQLLNGLAVQGWGAGSNQTIHGNVHGLFATIFGHRFDLVIGSINSNGLTSVGDSGLVWLMPSGEALGVHIGGDAAGPGGTSNFGFAQFAFRLADRLRLSLLSA